MKRAMQVSLVVLCALVAATASAQLARKSGDWSVDYIDGGIQMAGTENASGNAFGVICLTTASGCFSFISLSDTTCTKGNTVPLLMNSAVGAKSMQATCTIIDAKPPMHLMFLDDFEGAISAIESGGEVAFAFPLKSGKFEVYRFSTKGAVSAVREARTPPTSRDAVPVRGGPKNQIL
ncbi:MAG TPA: hypothetical protein PLZ79_09020 [Burkholderiales bacterium]|nr:hypothetical protein [Burkholderiaceae bacterium]HQR53401.1 hypothetical protein [Burkholderiales bacterium]